MTTQRDRLAAAIHATACDGMAHTDTVGYGEPNGMDEDLADALLARGVRVLDAETLGRALAHASKADGQETDFFTRYAVDVLAALDA